MPRPGPNDVQVRIAARLYTVGWTLNELADLLGFTWSCWERRLTNAGVAMRRPSRRPDKWVGNDLAAVAIPLYEAGMSYMDVGRQVGRTGDAVSELLRRRGVMTRARPPAADSTYFDEPLSERAAYWLGFILGDGTVKNRSTLAVELQGRDADHLDRLRADLAVRGKVLRRRRGNHVVLHFGTVDLVNRLSKLAVVPRKGCRHFFPRVPRAAFRHVIRGLFDADGTLYFQPAAGRQPGRYRFCIVGSVFCLRAIGQILVHELNVTVRYRKDPRVASRTFAKLDVYRWRDVLAVTNWLYSGATIWLPRKREIYQGMLGFLSTHPPRVPMTSGQRRAVQAARSHAWYSAHREQILSRLKAQRR